MFPIHRSRSGATRSLALVATVVAFALVAGACADQSPSPSMSALPVASAGAPAADVTATGTPRPTASPTSVPAPSATPTEDVATRFHQVMTSPVFSAKATIDGALTVGDVSMPVSGTFATHGANSRQTVTVRTPTGDQTSGSASIDGHAYELRGGLWYESSAKRSSAAAGDAFARALDVTDLGQDARDGKLVHRLVPKSGSRLPASTLGTTLPADASLTIEFYATFEGDPVVMAISAAWTQRSGAVSEPASMTMDFHFSEVGFADEVEPPDQVWSLTTSKRLGYSIAYPTDWEFDSGDQGPERPVLRAGRQRSVGRPVLLRSDAQRRDL